MARLDDLDGDNMLLQLVRGTPNSDAPYHPSLRGSSLGSGSRQQAAPVPSEALSSLVRRRRFTEARGEKFGEPYSEKKAVNTLFSRGQEVIDVEEKDREDIEKETQIEEGKDESEQKEGVVRQRSSARAFFMGLLHSPTSQLKKLIRGGGEGDGDRALEGQHPFRGGWEEAEPDAFEGLPPLLPFPLGKSRGFEGRKKKKSSKGRKNRMSEINLLVPKGKAIMAEFENKFMADSSRGPKESRSALVMEILKKISSNGEPMPVTTKSLKMLSGLMWKAGYKSIEIYLSEVKQLHIEHGHVWTQLLDMVFKKCKRAAARDRGPRKKAPEVRLEVRKAKRKALLPASVPVLFPKELFLFAMVWMLREIDFAEIFMKDVVFDKEKKLVELHWRKDKMDQAAAGKMRVLACRCAAKTCMPECPYGVSLNLVNKVNARFAVADRLCYLKKHPSKPPTKSQITSSWSLAYGQKVTGHSGRRTGALNYIRLGWSIPQVSYLGRWKSAVVYDYAQEALQESPVNQSFEVAKVNGTINVEDVVKEDLENELREQFVKLQIEVDEFKRDAKRAAKNLAKEVKDIANNYGSEINQPPYVMSIGSKVVHQNLTPVTNTPALLWKTRCGWAFKDGGFCFAPASEKVTCSKCLYYMDAQVQGGGTASNGSGFQL